MIEKLKIKTLMTMSILSVLMLISNSCSKNDGDSSQIVVNSFGPGSIMRGQQLQFIGNHLDQVTSIILPSNIEVTTFATKTSSLLVIDVPTATTNGFVTLKTPQGDITTKTKIVILEPITIKTIAPGAARVGTTVKIQGTYLNLVASVTFGVNKVVTKANFVSQSESEIDVVIPKDAQTGKIALADAQTIPNVIQSKDPFTVTLPVASSVSPTTPKAGSSNLTITGTDLDLVKDVTFIGGTRIDSTHFVSLSSTQIVVAVPANAKDGQITLRPLSHVEVATPAITLVAPVVNGITPNPAKNSGMVTVTGTDLDLVSQVTFGGGKTGTIQSGGSATSITVSVPKDALDGKVKFTTQSAKWDSTKTVVMVRPTISTFTASVNTKNTPSITIDGTDVDLASSVIFKADSTLFPPSGVVTAVQKDITVNSSGEIAVKVPQGAKTGKFILVTTNGFQLSSGNDLTIVPDMPTVTAINPTAYVAGQTITFTAASGLDTPFDVYFPNGTATGLIAPMVVSKSATSMSIVVPVGAKGGRIKLVNYANESYTIPIDVKVLGPDPVLDKNLVFFDYNGTGKDSWWGDIGSVVNGSSINPSITLDGSGYFSVNVASLAPGWHGLFWRNGGNNFPGSTIGTAVADYVMKFDITVMEDATSGYFQVRLKGSEGDFFAIVGPGANTGTSSVVTPLTSTHGAWRTITVPLSIFRDNYGWGSNAITDLSKIDSDFGMAYDPSSANTTLHLAVDNVRFEHK